MTSKYNWQEFCTYVASFGHADGFVTIRFASEGEIGVGLPHGYEHEPPHVHYIVRSTTSRTVDIQQVEDYFDEEDKKQKAWHKWFMKLPKAQLKKLGEVNDPRLNGGEDRTAYWIVECKSTLVCRDSKLLVRDGFWTRIISPDLELAKEYTMREWYKEAALPDIEKYGDYEKNISAKETRKLNEPRALICDMLDHNSFQPLYDITVGKYADLPCTNKILEKFKAADWFSVAEILWDLEEDFNILLDAIKNKINRKDFIAFYHNEKDLDENRRKSRVGKLTIPGKTVFKEIKDRSKRRNEFLRSLRKKACK